MVRAWGAGAICMETIRFAAANRLCVQLDYTKEDGERTAPTIEPYPVRRTSAGDLLLFGVKADTGESMSYRLDCIRSATVTRQAYRPCYAIELTATGPLDTPTIARPPAPVAPPRFDRLIGATESKRAPFLRPARGFGVSYTFACAVCGKTFRRSTYDSTLNPHKNK